MSNNSRLKLFNNLQLGLNEDYVDWKFIEYLYMTDIKLPAFDRVAPKITKRHVQLDSAAKMRVFLATQVSF